MRNAEAQFKRRVNGQLSQWESLGDDEAKSLRAQVTAKKQEIQALDELFDDRDRQRQKKHYRGPLRPMPGTVDELLRLGFAKHPIQAYRPEGPFMLHTVDGVLVLDGPIVRLESAGVQWKERLETADMVVRMADVKAIEAAAKSPQTAPATDTAPAQNTAKPAPVEELDYSLVATPAQLLDAFGKWGMQAWFDDLNSRKWLLDARRKKGQGTQGQVIPPLFCPFAVMNGLIGKVRKSKRLQPDAAWRTLEHKFPKVYATFESHDLRDRTGD